MKERIAAGIHTTEVRSAESDPCRRVERPIAREKGRRDTLAASSATCVLRRAVAWVAVDVISTASQVQWHHGQQGLRWCVQRRGRLGNVTRRA